MRRAIAILRQYRFPKGHRIVVPSQGAEQAAMQALTEQLMRVREWSGADASLREAGATEPSVDVQTFAFLCTQLWSLRRRMSPSGGQPKEEFRRVFPAVRRAWDKLADEGVEVLEHEGEAYDPGLALDVMSLEVIPGVKSEVILRTERPTILIRGERIQTGEVIVGIPDDGGHRPGTTHPPST